ncbi:MAG: PH domain-containing protein, partial [Nitrososphaeraceae archaeon]
SEITKIAEMLSPDEKVLLVAKQSRIKPGGSYITPNIVYATDRRIIIRDPCMLGLKENIVDIPYDIITSVKLEKNILSSTIRFKAPGLVSSTRLGMMEEIIDGQEDEEGGKIESIPKKKAEDLIEIIRSGMQGSKKVPYALSTKREESSVQVQSETLDNEGRTNTRIQSDNHSATSIADELAKLAKLRDQGIITEAEFVQMKGNLIKRT